MCYMSSLSKKAIGRDNRLLFWGLAQLRHQEDKASSVLHQMQNFGEHVKAALRLLPMRCRNCCQQCETAAPHASTRP